MLTSFTALIAGFEPTQVRNPCCCGACKEKGECMWSVFHHSIPHIETLFISLKLIQYIIIIVICKSLWVSYSSKWIIYSINQVLIIISESEWDCGPIKAEVWAWGLSVGKKQIKKQQKQFSDKSMQSGSKSFSVRVVRDFL